MHPKNLVILFGGNSEERRVSVASAQNMAAALPESRLWFLSPAGAVHPGTLAELQSHERAFEREFLPAQPPLFKNIEAALRQSPTESTLFVLALHGGEGENGGLQEKFERSHFAFTGSGSAASARAFDKVQAKAIAQEHKILICPQVEFNLTEDAEAAEQDLQRLSQHHPELILKPVSGGSSIGLYHVRKPSDLTAALKEIKESGNVPYLAEPFLKGREITVGVIHNGTSLQALPPSEVQLESDHEFDYEGKYLGKGSKEITPAEIDAGETLACQRLALRAHEVLGCEGYSRTDVILTEKGPVFLELNTLPGLTRASFIPQQLAVAGISLAAFLQTQISIAWKKRVPEPRNAQPKRA